MKWGKGTSVWEKGKQSHPKRKSTLLLLVVCGFFFASIGCALDAVFDWLSLHLTRSTTLLIFPHFSHCAALPFIETTWNIMVDISIAACPSPPTLFREFQQRLLCVGSTKRRWRNAASSPCFFRDSRRAILDLIASNSLLTITPDLCYYQIINGARANNSIDFCFQRGRLLFLSRCQYKSSLSHCSVRNVFNIKRWHRPTQRTEIFFFPPWQRSKLLRLSNPTLLL